MTAVVRFVPDGSRRAAKILTVVPRLVSFVPVQEQILLDPKRAHRRWKRSGFLNQPNADWWLLIRRPEFDDSYNSNA